MSLVHHQRARRPWRYAVLIACNVAYASTSKSTHIAFSENSPLASASEIARRTLSPLVALDVTRQAARSGKSLNEGTISLGREDFVIYVPKAHPAHGYALLVFIPPWQDARLPAGWAPILERYGTIFVSAARSGNEEGVMDRREPLALLAAANVMRQFPVDPGAVFISGFSGGARVAQRLALAYPDLFRGAIMNAGSDPIGSEEMPLPPKNLFYRFQENSRMVYVTGEADPRLGSDQESIRSMHQWCVYAVQSHVERSAGHEVLGSTAFAWALSAILNDIPPVSPKLPGCRAAIDQDVNSQLDTAERQLAGDAPASGEKLLRKIDARYGGLAAPRSIELSNRYAAIQPP